MMETDDAIQNKRQKADDIFASALIASYDHATSHISEFAKLQYQLVAVAYGLAGAAIVFFNDQLTQSQSHIQKMFLLVLPAVFYALVFVQIYLHSQIKKYGRYINYKLRPKMEAIVQASLNTSDTVDLWDWEESYKHGLSPTIIARVESIVTRILSLLVIALPLVPALGAIVTFELLSLNRNLTKVEMLIRYINIAALVASVVTLGIVGYINLGPLEEQGKKYAVNNKEQILRLLVKISDQVSEGSKEKEVVAAMIEDQKDPIVLYQAAILCTDTKQARRLLRQARKLQKHDA